MPQKKEQEFRDLASFAATGVKMTIEGKEYSLTPLGPKDYAEFESYVRSHRLDAFWKSQIYEQMEVAERNGMLLSIVRSDVDVVEEARTATGRLFLLWRSFIKNQPELTMEDVGRLLIIEGSLPEIAGAISEVEVKGENPQTAPKGAGPTGSV